MRVGRSMIALTSRSAASSGVSVGTLSYILVGAIIGVFTSGMLIVVKLMRLPESSPCAQRLNASSAAFDATYAENRGEFASPPIELLLMMWPLRRWVIVGMTTMIRRLEECRVRQESGRKWCTRG